MRERTFRRKVSVSPALGAGWFSRENQGCFLLMRLAEWSSQSFKMSNLGSLPNLISPDQATIKVGSIQGVHGCLLYGKRHKRESFLDEIKFFFMTKFNENSLI